jgi:2-iminobutanoate/2-iminopropanoate deaminase
LKINIRTGQACIPESPIAQGTKANGFIFTTGQLGRDPETGHLAPTLEGQIETALRNLQAVVEAGGGDLSTVVKITAYVKDLNFVPAFNKAFIRFFPENPPSRSCVEVSRLAKDAMIVMDAVAAVKR